jgi:hypothetical protein
MPKAGQWKLHVINIWRLLKICLVEGRNLLKCYARHIEGAVHLDSCKACFFLESSIPKTCRILEGGPYKPNVGGERSAFELGAAGEYSSCEPGIAGECDVFEPSIVEENSITEFSVS